MHIGTTVYNLNSCALPHHQKGLYTWDGKMWQMIENLDLAPEVLIFQDQEGKDFKARKFGDAGIWMTENLSVLDYADGSGRTLRGIAPANPIYTNEPGYETSKDPMVA